MAVNAAATFTQNKLKDTLPQALERLIGTDGVRRRLRPRRQRRKRRGGGGDQPSGQKSAPRKAREIALLAHECIIS